MRSLNSLVVDFVTDNWEIFGESERANMQVARRIKRLQETIKLLRQEINELREC